MADPHLALIYSGRALPRVLPKHTSKRMHHASNFPVSPPVGFRQKKKLSSLLSFAEIDTTMFIVSPNFPSPSNNRGRNNEQNAVAASDDVAVVNENENENTFKIV